MGLKVFAANLAIIIEINTFTLIKKYKHQNKLIISCLCFYFILLPPTFILRIHTFNQNSE